MWLVLPVHAKHLSTAAVEFSAQGFPVSFISQRDWRNEGDFTRLREPKRCCGVVHQAGKRLERARPVYGYRSLPAKPS